jgi:hypothetical protein
VQEAPKPAKTGEFARMRLSNRDRRFQTRAPRYLALLLFLVLGCVSQTEDTAAMFGLHGPVKIATGDAD